MLSRFCRALRGGVAGRGGFSPVPAKASPAAVRRAACWAAESLEPRRLMAFTPTAITQYHVDNASNGVNATETLLTPSTVNVNQFGKQFATPVDGQVYAEPLYVPGVNITSGTQQGTHNVVYVATEHDSLYAVDATGGNVLWKRAFQSVEDPTVATGTPTLVNPLGATAIAPMPASETGSGDVTVEIGITATPVIDLPNKFLYLVAKSKQTVNGAGDHYVHVLYKIDIGSGAVVNSTVIGDTRYSNGNYSYITTGAAANTPYVVGTGDGAINVGGQSRVYFNGIREFGRVGLQLYNGTIYMGFASHGDNGPYHGWMLAYNASTLAIGGALNTTPNGGLGGIWQGGGTIGVDPQGNFYFETGNGSFNTNASNFGTNYTGLPKDGNYGDAFVKVSLDPTTTPTNQNKNGWGLKVVDFFSPFNNAQLNGADTDLGSSGLTILPDAVGSAAHPHLLVGSGKEGKIYLVDRDNMGGFSPTTDKVVQVQGSALSGLLNTPAFFFNNPQPPSGPGVASGTLLFVMGYGGGAKAYGISNGVLTTSATSVTTNDFGYLPGSPTVSADGITNGILWAVNRNNNKVYAYRADNLGVELWDSGQAAANRDQLGTAVKFTVPTVADGQVFVGTANALVVYGPPVPPTAPPAAPATLAAAAPAFNRVVLSWQDLSSNEDGFRVERTLTPDSPASWAEIGTVSANGTTYTDATTLATTTYSYRVRAFNSFAGGSLSAYSNVATVTTPQAPPTGTGDGLLAAYFNDANGAHLSGAPALTRVDPQVATDWGNGGPGGPIGTNNFSARWTGRVQAQYSQAYTFYTTSDDGVRLYIKATTAANYTTLIDNWNDHSPTENSGTFTMSAGQQYDIKMEYYEGGGGATAQLSWSSASTDKTFIPQSQLYSGVAPAAPTNLTATPTSGTQVNLGWKDNAGIETGFVVERLDPGAGYVVVATLPPNTTTYFDTSLNPDTTYQYRVRATNFAANSAYSNVVGVTTPIPPAKPTGAHPTAVTTTSIAMAWTDVATNEDGYRISRSAADTDNFIVIAQLPADSSSYLDLGPNGNGLTPGVEYEYHIQAYNVAGYNDFSGFRTATVTLAPTGLAAAAGNGKAVVTWTPPPFEGSATTMTFNVYRGAAGGGPYTMVGTELADPTFTDTGLTNGTPYYYVVTAVDAGGESARSIEAVVTPTGGPSLSATAVGDGTAQRSMVTAVKYTFSAPVTFGAGAVTAAPHPGANDGGPIATVGTVPALAWTTTDGGLTYVVTFSGAGVTNGSIADGVYDLTLHAALVTGTGGAMAGGDQITTFHRLFGDQDGNKTVNNADYVRFRAAFGSNTGGAAYNAVYDFDGNGTINNADYVQFRNRFGITYSWA